MTTHVPINFLSSLTFKTVTVNVPIAPGLVDYVLTKPLFAAINEKVSERVLRLQLANGKYVYPLSSIGELVRLSKLQKPTPILLCDSGEREIDVYFASESRQPMEHRKVKVHSINAASNQVLVSELVQPIFSTLILPKEYVISIFAKTFEAPVFIVEVGLGVPVCILLKLSCLIIVYTAGAPIFLAIRKFEDEEGSFISNRMLHAMLDKVLPGQILTSSKSGKVLSRESYEELSLSEYGSEYTTKTGFAAAAGS